MGVADPRELLLDSFRAAIAAADPLRILAPALPGPAEIAGYRRTLVAGAGKAAASMALAVERHWPAQAPLEGLVVTRHGHGLPCARIRVVEAGHPLPDAAGEGAAAGILAAAEELGDEDLLLVLLSGGGSSLLALPVPSVPMADLRATTGLLLASGAPIQEVNTVRKHLSRIQGGQLAAATRATVLALVLSDVAGDDISSIASGPCAPDPGSFGDALEVLERWRVDAPAPVLAHLRRGREGRERETPKPGDPVFSRVEHRLVATAHGSLEAAARVFEGAGVRPVLLGDTVTGEARDVAAVMAAITREVSLHGQPFRRPVALISGGECTVTVRGRGRGGRCAEFALALAQSMNGVGEAWAIAADTDGIDGTEDNAGALVGPDTLERAARAGLDPRRMLDDNDAWSFFAALGDLVVTGRTRTNVNDYRAILLA